MFKGCQLFQRAVLLYGDIMDCHQFQQPGMKSRRPRNIPAVGFPSRLFLPVHSLPDVFCPGKIIFLQDIQKYLILCLIIIIYIRTADGSGFRDFLNADILILHSLIQLLTGPYDLLLPGCRQGFLLHLLTFHTKHASLEFKASIPGSEEPREYLYSFGDRR